ncbi:hypothetical protein [Methylobacterium sp. NPDC014615]
MRLRLAKHQGEDLGDVLGPGPGGTRFVLAEGAPRRRGTEEWAH